MTPVKCPWMNTNFQAEGCTDLPSFVPPDETPRRSITVWRPSAEEVIAIMEGRPVILVILGSQPPCSLHVMNETTQDENGYQPEAPGGTTTASG